MENIEQTIKAAMKFNMKDVMKRYEEKTRLPPEVLKEHEREIKRFLSLSAANLVCPMCSMRFRNGST